MWKTIGENIANYRSYPRIVGETGGKDFVFAHPDCDVEGLNVALCRGAFEYQGQSVLPLQTYILDRFGRSSNHASRHRKDHENGTHRRL